jgi:hypothetical protein
VKKSKQEGSKPSPPKVTTKIKNEMLKLSVKLVACQRNDDFFKKNAATSA